MIIALLLALITLAASANVETLHFESACLQQTNAVHLNLRCPQYEHIQIVRVIYGYTKQPLVQECHFSIYDCIQEGASHNILSCNGKETCLINLTKNEMLSSSISTPGVPGCPDFNYIQVNFGCIPDSKDICDAWKDEASVIHLSHTYSKDRTFNRCHCKVRSSLPNGQVLLHAREMNRQHTLTKTLIMPKTSNLDCKKTTYLEIATRRSERKCMDMLPTNNIALFGSGSHNFTLSYVKNDPFSELFFYLELKASPMSNDHHVQIICNWARRQTTTTTTTLATTAALSTTIPVTKKRKTSTISMQRGGKLSRLDLIRHRPPSGDAEETTPPVDNEPPPAGEEEVEETTVPEGEEGYEEEEEPLPTTTIVVRTSKTRRIKTKKTSTTTTTAMSTIETTSTTTVGSTSLSDEDEWARILALANGESAAQSKQVLSINNRTFVTAAQASAVAVERHAHASSASSHTLLIILLVVIAFTCLLLILYCLRVKQPGCIQRLRTNANVAFLFCCEASKLLFCSPKDAHQRSQTTSNTPPSSVGTRRHRRRPHRPSPSVPDYQSSEYYLDETGNPCRTTQSIYDGGGGEKSIYSIDYDDEETEYTTKYGRQHDAGSC